MTDTKSFRINVTYLKQEEILHFEFYLKNNLIVKVDAFFINIPLLKEGIVNDISIGDTIGIKDKNPILVTGCGHFGCCPGLFWKLTHEDDLVIISNVHWVERDDQYCFIEGEFQVQLADYRSEVLNLERRLKSLLLSNPELLIILRKQASPLRYFLKI